MAAAALGDDAWIEMRTGELEDLADSPEWYDYLYDDVDYEYDFGEDQEY